MTHDGRAANYVIDAADRDGRAIHNLSLQKLVYFWSVAPPGDTSQSGWRYTLVGQSEHLHLPTLRPYACRHIFADLRRR